MQPAFSSLLIASMDALGVERTWSLGHEGLSPGWAFLIFGVLAAATIVAYFRCATRVKWGKRIVMMVLRLIACAVMATLLTKPVLRIQEQRPVKQPVAVVVDASKSMSLSDRRETPSDLNRAAMAIGLVDPSQRLDSSPSDSITAQVKDLSRHDLITKLGDNRKLDVWSKVAARADLLFYRFGATTQPLGAAATTGDDKKQPSVTWPKIDAEETATGIGEAVRQVLQEPRGQALGGIIVLTDGGNNHGSSPLEAAQIAKEQNVPLFLYGVGVSSPPDLEIKEVTAQRLAFVGERLEVKARVVSRNLDERPDTITLTADGEPVDKVNLSLGGDHEQDVVFHLVPKKAGEVKLEVSVPVRAEEIGKDNNRGSTTVRVTDKKFNVLLVEQAPRWDFRYLLDYLQRDERLEVKCVMIEGEPGLERMPDSPFLTSLPDSREKLFQSQVLILGDVNPDSLGQERMEMIVDWVEAGGGIIFLAGPNFNPGSYAGTPLEPLLPVVPDTSRPREWNAQKEPEPFALELTTQGRLSPYLQMDPDPAVNRKIWSEFPGVRWVAPVLRVKTGAEVLLVDPRSSSAGRYGQLPVFAMQGYGSGKCVYFGTDETHRWRSRTGEKYYSILWGQIMQTLALQLLDGASSLTQLRTDRKEYAAGDKVTISGNAYNADYSPLMQPSLEGVLTIEKNGAAPRSLNLTGTGRNGYRGEFVATEPGRYSFHTLHDPNGVLKFEVIDTNLESSQTAMDDRLLKNMAAMSGGRFLREEDLKNLPDWITAVSTKVATSRKIDLYYSGWVLAGMIALLCAEWLMRRLARLK